MGEFYPQDMPVEWWLTFYQTQFSCVWLSREAWQGLSTDAWYILLEDVRADFRFLLEGTLDEIHLRHASLRDDVRVIADVDARIIRFDMQTSLDTLTPRLRDRHENGAIYLVSHDARMEKLHEVATLLELLGM